MNKSTATATATATAVIRDAVVAKSIAAAGRAAGTMLAKVKEAAHAAAGQLDPSLPLGACVDAVMAAYADDFRAVDPNIKSLFKDALTLLAAGKAPVTLVTKVKGEEVEKHITAAEALAAPKHAMRDAAKQVRDQNGLGRATSRTAGGGARHAAPKADKVITAGDKLAVGTDDAAAFAAWLDNVGTYMENPKTRAAVIAAFKDEHWNLTTFK